MLHVELQSMIRRSMGIGTAVIAICSTAACMASAHPSGSVADLGDPNPAGCVGPATIVVNNTYSQPVDIFAGLSGGRETFLGTAQPGRSEYAVTDAGASYAVRAVGKREIIEATSRPRPATDRVQFKTVCKSAA